MSIKPARIALALSLAVFVAGCASNKPTYQPAPFTPATIPAGEFVPKVDAFALVLDASSSMGENRHANFFAGKDVVSQLNQTIPELGYQGALATFGPGCMLDKGLARLWYGPETYSTAALGDALASIKCAGGPTPMELGIEAGGSAATDTTGQVAVIVVSDFEDIDTKAAAGALAKIEETYGDRVCLHAIQVGNNAGGAEDRAEIAGATSCGSAVSASELGSAAAMSAYVQRVLLAPAPRSNDADGDGVADADDRCPGTPAGANVNTVGCWWVGADDVLFDFDKAEIKSTFMLDEAIDVLKRNPDVNVEVQGHTDNVGDPDYNVGLSERRANAVRDYMIAKGIPSSRLTAKGYGMTRPHFSNDSEQGRALNRRVELHPYR
jgi:OOP family OmpA-OmpF porin